MTKKKKRKVEARVRKFLPSSVVHNSSRLVYIYAVIHFHRAVKQRAALESRAARQAGLHTQTDRHTDGQSTT